MTIRGEASNSYPAVKKIKIIIETLAGLLRRNKILIFGGAKKDKTSEEWTAPNRMLKMRILVNLCIGESNNSYVISLSGMQVARGRDQTLKMRIMGSPKIDE